MVKKLERKAGDICFVGSGSTKVEILNSSVTGKNRILCRVIEKKANSIYDVGREYYIPARSLSRKQVNFPVNKDKIVKERILKIVNEEPGIDYKSIIKHVEIKPPFQIRFLMSELVREGKVRWEGRIKGQVISKKNPKVFFIKN